TLVRFHCLRLRLSAFCLPVSCSSALWRKPWANDEADGYQPPSYEPVNPERGTPQVPSDGLI
ncbi:MAG: hypothetical protein KH329_06825, partial [Bifidobacterium longum]|nr:hypothetical protein [Bifidobacterium longum]MDU2403229.1 hypothetical protein [Bifidobacterium longum]